MTLQLSVYGALIFCASALGGVLPLAFKGISEKFLKRYVSFGAGLLLGMALLHMLPEAAEWLPRTFGIWLLAGFLLLLILERFMMVHSCDEHGCSYHHIGVAAFMGLSVHGVIEGLALASSVVASPKLGPMIFLAILAHKVPAGFALSTLLRLASKSDRQIGLFTLGLAISGPIGIAMAYSLLNLEGLQEATGALLALSAGTFLYISACDLLPELHANHKERLPRLAFFLAGLAICAFASHGAH
jgi:zinc and cadmium transporter